ncbi:uncharacterized protein BXZ73DRAFT_81214 [Epithele typhae]|uniref:uncharacterized protein n=1 Tax=Epithele typhae TaxID=378194 RepID=UPI002007AAD5|nr:uncharacterized protein BXZ73DRAFT_81214 [Epithele typhae]KAH9915942.1 hypothetical protein BXZ73DRAFT_81214 [Epithele typhae]
MPECIRCDFWFYYEWQLQDHLETSPAHNICLQCNVDFASDWALVQHFVQSPHHHYCQRCDKHFNTLPDLYDHYDDEHSWCDLCIKIFKNSDGLHEHRRQSHPDLYCVSCRRMFGHPSNLQSHLRSSLHQGHEVPCPLRGCGRSFVSRSGLIVHLESGACASGMDRRQLDELIGRLDRNGIITDPARMIAGPAAVEVTEEWATERAWNGHAYQCYVCARQYRTLPALNQHLRSPAHATAKYRCPAAYRGCDERFKTLSAFVAHVESEACGASRFKRDIEIMIDGMSSNFVIPALKALRQQLL